MLLLNLNPVLLNEVTDLILGQGLLVGCLEPVGESEPLILTCLQSAFLLQHLDPLLRSSLVHLDLVQSHLSIGDESVLGLVGLAEHHIAFGFNSLIKVSADVVENPLWSCMIVRCIMVGIIAISEVHIHITVGSLYETPQDILLPLGGFGGKVDDTGVQADRTPTDEVTHIRLISTRSIAILLIVEVGDLTMVNLAHAIHPT